MSTLLERRAVCALIIIAATAALYLPGLGSVPFYTKGEPREGIEVWEIVHNGHWVLPMRNGVELPSKPPLFHWLGSLTSIAVGEVNEFTIRFPSALLGAGTVLAVFFVGARRWGNLAGLFAALALATSFEWMRSATHARVDMTLTACLTAALFGLDRAIAAKRPSLLALGTFYVGMGLATLSKGPVGLILPSLVGVVVLAIRREPMRLWTDARPIIGGLIAVAIPLAWYVGATVQGGEAFFEKQILQENFGRFFEAEESNVGHIHSPLYLVGGFALGFLPWSPLFVALGLSLVRARNKITEHELLFPLVWFVTIFAFFSISEGKRTVYLLPAYPAAALIFGWWWAQVVETGWRELARSLEVLLRGAGILLITSLGVVGGILLAEGMGAAPLVTLAPILSVRDQQNILAVRGIIDQNYTWLLITFGALIPLIAGFFACIRTRRWGTSFGVLVVAVIVTTGAVSTIFQPALAHKRTYKPFMEEVRAIVRPTDTLSFGGGTFDYGAVYYSRRHIRQLGAGEGLGPQTTESRIAYLLLWESSWVAYPPEVRASLEELLWSSGNGPKGRERLVFVRRR